MSAHTSTARNDSGVRPRYIALGVDATGAQHCYDTERELVHVVRDGRRELVKEIEPGTDDRSIDAWMADVADARGWNRTYYRTNTLADRLAATVSRASADGGRERRLETNRDGRRRSH